jgi:hypothetical protein
MRSRYGEPTDFAILELGGASITLVRNEEAAGTGTTYLVASGIDLIYERCKAAEADLDSQLEERPYGMRDFTVHDLDGNHVIVGERV